MDQKSTWQGKSFFGRKLTFVQVDRRERFYLNLGYAFPNHENPELVLRNTVLDAELVIDVDRPTGKVGLLAVAVCV
jgi:hypothetical protein